ncbi:MULTISPECIES: response regulator transcription factor [Emticicia]|uniref:response regulator transcription factor n=1 Tax=Emticicia TaxID=312278 RepID=UPI0007D8A140|nr:MULTISPECIES: response regulator transcription factor [Emticicia]
MSEIRILIIEDDPIIAADIADYLNNVDYRVSGIAYNPTQAYEQLKTNLPDLILLDINLSSEQNGIDIATFIHQNHAIPFIFLTSYSTRDVLNKAKITEPSGYIVKPFDEEDLFATIEIALYNFAQKQKYTRPLLDFSRINKSIVNPLSDREFEVLQQIFEGKTNQQMADALFVSVSTIKTHISNIFFKFEVNSRTSLMAKVRN